MGQLRKSILVLCFADECLAMKCFDMHRFSFFDVRSLQCLYHLVVVKCSHIILNCSHQAAAAKSVLLLCCLDGCISLFMCKKAHGMRVHEILENTEQCLS